jgi:site-specific DNA recombinase
MEKVALYARVSTDDKQDYDRQVRDLTEVAMKDGWSKENILIFAEHMSGYKKVEERPQLNKLMAKALEENTEIKRVYITEISRLGRDPKETRKTIDELTDIGIPMYIHSHTMCTIGSNGKRNNLISIVLQILIEFADTEAKLFKQRSKSGLRTAAEKGKALSGGSRPYGYTADADGMLVVEEQEAAIIREIFRLYSEGYGSAKIATFLNDRHIPTRMNKTHNDKIVKFSLSKSGKDIRWSDPVVRGILMNTIYYGKRNWQGEFYDAPAIIEETLFVKCREIRENKTHRNYETNYLYLLKDIIKCGNCDRNFFARYKPAPNGDKVYVCSSRLKPQQPCGNRGVNISLIESAIADQLRGISNEVWHRYYASSEKEKTVLNQRLKGLKMNLKSCETELRAEESKTERLYELYMDTTSMTPEKYNERLRKIESHIERASEKVALTQRAIATVESAISDLNAVSVDQAFTVALHNREHLQALFRRMISAVRVKANGLDIALVRVQMRTEARVIWGTELGIILNVSGIKKKNKVFQYKAVALSVNPPVPDLAAPDFEFWEDDGDFDEEEWDDLINQSSDKPWITVKKVLTVQ